MFSRVAIVNRGEAAMRLIHAVRDLAAETGTPIETVALHTDVDRTRHVRARGRHRLRPRPRLRAPVPGPDRRWSARWWRPAPTPPGSAGASSPRTRRSRSCARRSASPSSGRAPEAMRKLGDKIGAKLIAEEVGVPVAPWSRGAVETLDAALAAAGRDRLPADAQGDRGRRRARHPRGHERGRAGRRLRAHQPGGRAGVRQRRRVPGAPGHRRPARRGPGHRRRPGHRVGAGRPRLLGAAAQPEGHRGVGVAGAQPRAGGRAEGVGRTAGRRGRLPRRGDRRVPLPPRRPAVRVPRGQHPAAGRAPDHRVHHRVRPGQGAAARGVRRPARGRAAGRARARHRGPAQRRGPRPRLRARPRAASRGWTCPPGRASAWTPASARATPSRPTSTR